MGWAQQGFKTIDLGAPRLNQRAVLLVERLGPKPVASIPTACENWAETAAAYRFLRNEQVRRDDVMKAHCRASQAVKKSQLHTFKVMPQRWVAGRSFA